MVRHRLSDDEWDLISDLFPEPTGVGRPPNNPRDMMDGMLSKSKSKSKSKYKYKETSRGGLAVNFTEC